MNTLRIIPTIAVITVAFLFIAGCTTTAVPPDKVVVLPPTNTPEPTHTATAVSMPPPTATTTPLPTMPPTPTPTFTPTFTPTPDAAAMFDALMQRGMIYVGKEEWPEAADAFAEAIAVDPHNARLPRAYNNLGLVFQQLSEWEQAISNFDQAIALDPGCPDFYSNRGLVWTATSEFDKAMADYNHAIALNPESPRYYYNRAIVYKQIGEVELALADYDHTVLLDPEFAHAYHNRAMIYWDMGHYEEALADFNKALALTPTDLLGLTNRGLLQLELEDLGAAQADFTQIITLCHPVSYAANEGTVQYFPVGDLCTLAYLYLALIDYDLGDYESALTDLSLSIFNDQELTLAELNTWVLDHPASGFAFFARGCAEEVLDDLASAQADYTQAIRLSGSDPLAQEYYFRRGFVCAMQGDVAAAVADWQQTIALEPTYADAYHNLGLIYGEMGEFETAVTTLQSALSQDIPQEDKRELANMLTAYAEHLATISENGRQAAKAIAAIQAVQTEVPELVIPAARLNNICWYTSLWGLADDALFACERAVEMEPENVSFRDSRGLARALTGDLAGAKEDFQFVIAEAGSELPAAAITRRTEWLKALESGVNPFTDALLAELRGEY